MHLQTCAEFVGHSPGERMVYPCLSGSLLLAFSAASGGCPLCLACYVGLWASSKIADGTFSDVACFHADAALSHGTINARIHIALHRLFFRLVH